MPRSKAASPEKAETPEVRWRAVRWEDLEGWAGKKTVDRGKNYQEEGRVEDLAVTNDGGLLATVSGTDDYATHVWLEGEAGRLRPESMCSCPVGHACKHAVATVVQYLHALAAKSDVPRADEDDPRWYDLDEPDDEGYDDEPRPKRSRLAWKDWDERILAHLRSTPQPELVGMIWGVAKAAPDVYERLRERVALRELDSTGLVAEARREIQAATSVDPWRSHWDGEGEDELPDYRPVRKLLERLLELGRFDDVVKLGKDLLQKGFRQLRRAEDEGETETRLHACLPVVFQAVAQSSLTGPERLLFAIDAILEDPNDVVGDAADSIFDAPPAPTDWSAVADVLSARLNALPTASGSRDYETRFARQSLADWLAEALENAGREDELPALYEAEARATGDRTRFIAHLMDADRLDDAEREARAALAEKLDVEPGTAAGLTKTLAELAARRGRWDVVAAHAAHEFFDLPGVESFKTLRQAAAKAGVETAVRAAALEFLRTGRKPYAWVAATAAPKPKAGKKAAATPAQPPHLKVDPSWPLPIPDEVVATIKRRGDFEVDGPRLGVLIDLALEEGDPGRALDAYDAMTKATEGVSYSSFYHGGPGRYADRVAEAVAASHSDRALGIYKTELDRNLPIADPAAYERSAGYLAKLRPIYDALGRGAEWRDLVATAREKYRNRPRFLDQLDQTLGRPAGAIGRKTP